MFWMKIHRVGMDVLIAICDEEILGKKIKWKNVEIEIRKEFYGGKRVNEKEVLDALREMTVGNFFGNRIVHLMIRKGIVKKENVIKIGGIAHAQYIKI